MGLKAGIVGLPNVGKSTLFNAITSSHAEAANYPFATISPNVGSVLVNDERVDNLVKLFNPKRTIYTSFEFFDIRFSTVSRSAITNSKLIISISLIGSTEFST